MVLVHGLYMAGIYMKPLQRRIARCGFDVVQFSYPSVRHTVPQNAASLQAFLPGIGAEVVHLVGHSLGGLVIRRMLHDYPDQRPGRIVTLGTPHQGSHVARCLDRWHLGRLLLGSSWEQGLRGDVPPWRAPRELGVIAGTLAVGLGWLVPGLPKPNDGTVAAAETKVAGMTDYIELRVTHTAMLFSARVAAQICVFLSTGRFAHAEGGAG